MPKEFASPNNEAPERWNQLEAQLRGYNETASGHPIYDIYKKAGTPHEEMVTRSAAIAGPALGIDRVEDLLKKIREFVEASVGTNEQRGSADEAEAAVSVLNRVGKEISSENPNALEVDKMIADFTKNRVGTFFGELEERMKIANPKNPEAESRLQIPRGTMQKFYQGAETFLGYGPIEKQRERDEFRKLYKLERQYPAAFLRNILESIYIKVREEIRPEKPGALDPMIPLSAVKEYK